MGFLESYKRLDNICKDIFESQKGITTYIETMEGIYNGKYYVSSWEDDYKQLKHYRYIRNQIAHENNINEQNMCNEYDTQWIEQFINRIMQISDPLTLYNNNITAVQKEQKASQKNVENNRVATPKNNSKKKAGCLSVVIVSIVILLAI